MRGGVSPIPVEAYKLRASYKALNELREYLQNKKEELIRTLIYGDETNRVYELRAAVKVVDDALTSLEFFFQTHLSEEVKYDDYAELEPNE